MIRRGAHPCAPFLLNEDVRINYVNIVIGRRGSGKTTFIKQLVQKHKKKVLIVDTLDHPSYREYPIIDLNYLPHWKSGVYRVVCSDFRELFSILNTKVFNALIVFEDCTKYIIHNIPDDVRGFVVDSKQKNLDLVFMYHGLGMVQPTMFRLADTITIFKTNENPLTYKSKIPNYPAFIKAYDYVDRSPNPYERKSILLN